MNKRGAKQSESPSRGRKKRKQALAAQHNIVQFFSKSAQGDCLGCGFPDWRRRLSNFYARSVRVAAKDSEAGGNEVTYPSVEHYFQAMKYQYSSRPELSARFAVGGPWKEAREAKRQGSKTGMQRHGAKLDRPRWDAMRLTVMTQGLQAVWAQHEDFRAILQEVKAQHKYLLHFERSGARSFWGGSVCKQTGQVRGQNHLGKIMMALTAAPPAVNSPQKEQQKQYHSAA